MRRNSSHSLPVLKGRFAHCLSRTSGGPGAPPPRAGPAPSRRPRPAAAVGPGEREGPGAAARPPSLRARGAGRAGGPESSDRVCRPLAPTVLRGFFASGFSLLQKLSSRRRGAGGGRRQGLRLWACEAAVGAALERDQNEHPVLTAVSARFCWHLHQRGPRASLSLLLHSDLRSPVSDR